MRPVTTGLVLFLFISTLYSQSERIDIPYTVIDQFALHYPDAEHIEWKVQNKKYLAVFTNNKKYTAVMYREDGKLLQSETEIRVIALPPTATSYLLNEVMAKKIESATIMEDESGAITFKAFTDKNQYWFDGEGHLYENENTHLAGHGGSH
jgi:hypothetical protein